MKKFWLLGCYLLFVLPGWGQARDTVLAIHKLFKQQRPKKADYVAASAAPLVQNSGSAVEKLTVATANGVTYKVIAFLQNRRFSVERETLIIQQYAQGIAIPADVRRRLHRSYFKRTAQDVSDGF